MDADKPEDLNNHLSEALRGANRAKDLVKQILTFSRKSDQQQEPLEIHLVVKEALKLLRSTIPTTIKMQVDIDKDCGFVEANPTQIHQVVMNLCTNAAQAVDVAGGVLNVSLRPVDLSSEKRDGKVSLKGGPYLKLEVNDNGPGISKGDIERIFEPYFTTKAREKGTGLGLSVVHGIVSNLGGEISVSSDLGKGTTFRIYLPVHQGKITDAGQDSTSQTQTGHERILLVDDEANIVNAQKMILEQLGYTVTASTSSLESLKLFKKSPNNFDLVITDMTMPDMTGAELSKQMLELRPDLPILLCTGYSESIDSDASKEIGIRSYLSKPYSKNELAQTIRKTLDG